MRVSSHDSKGKFQKFGKAGAGPKFGISTKNERDQPVSQEVQEVQEQVEENLISGNVLDSSPSSAIDDSVQFSKAPGPKHHRKDATAPIASEHISSGNLPASEGLPAPKLAQGKRKNSEPIGDDAPTVKMALDPIDVAQGKRKNSKPSSDDAPTIKIAALDTAAIASDRTRQPNQRALPSATTLPPPLGGGESEQLPPPPGFIAPQPSPSRSESGIISTVQVDASLTYSESDTRNNSSPNGRAFLPAAAFSSSPENAQDSDGGQAAPKTRASARAPQKDDSELSVSSVIVTPQDATEEAAAIAAIADLGDTDDETVENSYMGQPPTAPLSSGEHDISAPVVFADAPRAVPTQPAVPTMAEVARAAAWKWARKRESQGGPAKTPHPLRIALGILMIGVGIYLLAIFIPSHEPVMLGGNIGVNKWLFTEGQHSVAAAFAFAFLALGAFSLFRGTTYKPFVRTRCNHCQIEVNAARQGLVLKCENGGHRAGIQFAAVGLLIGVVGLVVGFIILTLQAG